MPFDPLDCDRVGDKGPGGSYWGRTDVLESSARSWRRVLSTRVVKSSNVICSGMKLIKTTLVRKRAPSMICR